MSKIRNPLVFSSRSYIPSRRWVYIIWPGHPGGNAVYDSVRLEMGERLEDLVSRMAHEFIYLDGPRARPNPRDGEWVMVTDRNHPFAQ